VIIVISYVLNADRPMVDVRPIHLLVIPRLYDRYWHWKAGISIPSVKSLVVDEDWLNQVTGWGQCLVFPLVL